MATVSVFVCPGAAQHLRTVTLSTEQYATCNSGQGAWTSVQLQEPFDPATLNSSELGAAFGAGFTVMGTALAITWAARQLISALRSSI